METLNSGQVLAKQQILEFLEGDQKFFALNAPAGFGKTFLLDNIRDTVQGWNFRWAATTNKAATVLDGYTVHKTFGFSVYNDYNTGTVRTGTKKAQPISRAVICIDEASMLSRELLRLVDEFSPNSKVILVGDQNQLAPVGEAGIPAFTSGYPSATLTEPMRQDKDSDLYQLCLRLRDGVTNTAFTEVHAGVNVEVHKNGQTFLNQLKHEIVDNRDIRVICYTNKTAISYNDYIRRSLGFGVELGVGDAVVSRRFTKDISEDTPIGVEETSMIMELEDGGIYLDIPFDLITLDNECQYRMPKNKADVDAALAEAKAGADWATYFSLQEGFVDLRAGFGITSHSSQGSTYDVVYVDMADIMACRSIDMMARMLYVAISRAKTRVVIYRG